MKRFYSLIAILVLFVSLAVSQSPAQGKQGKIGLLYTLPSLTELSADNYLGGAGAKYYLNNETAVRGSLGLTSASNSDTKPIFASAGLTTEFAHNTDVNGFLGLQGTLAHYGSNSDQFGLAAVVGAEWAAFSPNVTLTAESQLGWVNTSYSNTPSFSTWGLGATGSVTITLYVN